MKYDYFIIGNSAAAVGCIEGIRRESKNGKICVVSDENYRAYGRPLISYFLWGKTSEENMLKYRPKDFYEKNGADLILGTRAVKINPDSKTVSLSNGDTYEYGKLLVAAGSRPFVPQMAGFETVEKKFNFMTLDDAKALRKAVDKDSKVLIVGAGLIGLKCAEGISDSVKSITVVDLANRILPSILDETWNIIVPVTRDVYERLTDESAVQIEFTEDGRTLWVNFEERQISDGYYLFLKLNNSMVRYVQERFIEIELLLNKESGLKIPNTAITEKEFFKVPKEYFAKAQDSSGKGVMIKDPATGSINFIATSLYYETEDSYYIDEDEVHAGTVLQRPDSNETYTVGETAKLQGVYNINKGYAVFKQISILYQNEEYSIVETGTSYGLSLYDHIALDGSKVNENDLIN